MLTTLAKCIVAALALALLGAPLAAEAQQAGKLYRIGILSGASPVSEMSGPNPTSRSAGALLQRLRELGYVYGQNLVTEPRSAEGMPDRLPALAAELVQLQVDVIVASGPPAARAAQQATRTIPIVIAGMPDPVGSGVVGDLAPTRRQCHGIEFGRRPGDRRQATRVAQAGCPGDFAGR